MAKIHTRIDVILKHNTLTQLIQILLDYVQVSFIVSDVIFTSNKSC